MPTIDRRTFLKLMGLTATASTGLLAACSDKTPPTAAPAVEADVAAKAIPDDFYDLPMQGNVRILHTTDFHG